MIDPFTNEHRQMFELVRAFGFEPDEVVEGSLRFDGVNVKFVTMPGRVPRSFGLSGMNEAQKAAVNALTYPRIVQEDPVTTDPTPDLCCTHGQQLDTLAAELKRANQLLADLVEIRRGQDEAHREPLKVTQARWRDQMEQWKRGERDRPSKPVNLDEVVAFARGGIVKAPEGSEPVTCDPECDGLIITAEQVRRMGIPTLDELRRQLSPTHKEHNEKQD